jgi:hypothetical protein
MPSLPAVVESFAEQIVAKAKENHNVYIARHFLDDFPDSQSGDFNITIRKLLSEGLIKLMTPTEYQLTDKASNFTTFQAERDSAFYKESLSIRQMETNIQVSESVIATNASIISLNDKTERNYTIQKNLTIAIFVAAAVSAIAAVLPFFKDDEKTLPPQQDTLKIMQTKVQELEQSQQSQLKTDSFLLKVVKDSLNALP